MILRIQCDKCENELEVTVDEYSSEIKLNVEPCDCNQEAIDAIVAEKEEAKEELRLLKEKMQFLL